MTEKLHVPGAYQRDHLDNEVYRINERDGIAERNLYEAWTHMDTFIQGKIKELLTLTPSLQDLFSGDVDEFTLDTMEKALTFRDACRENGIGVTIRENINAEGEPRFTIVPKLFSFKDWCKLQGFEFSDAS